jgi:DNA-binding GntR family transcriptional regulator
MRANPEVATGELSPLQRRLAARIVADAAAAPEARARTLSELGLARTLGVSRTPVRAALEWLRAQGVMQRLTGGGWQLAAAAGRRRALRVPPPPPEDTDRLFVAIARDRVEERLDADVTEADLMRRYGVPRAVVLKVLARLAEVGLVERKRGHGWRFLALAYDDRARAESYAFRLLIEPAALLSPAFAAPAPWLAEMRRRHESMMAAPWRETSSVALFDLNAEFHEGLAAASGNRYFQLAIAQQNRLRRFVNVHWTEGAERVQVSCREHLEILARVERGECEVAAALMRRHLTQASML